MSVNSFLANFRGGLRANRFKVAVDGIDSKLEFLCRSATIPSSEIGVIPVLYQGIEIPVPGDRVGGRIWTIEIFADTDSTVRDELELWSELIRPQFVPGGLDITAAMRTATVDLLSTSNEVLKSYRMIKCWPSVIGELPMAHDSSDTIVSYTVDFSFLAWEKFI